MDDVDVLGGILDKTGALIDGTRREQWGDPTPCPEFDVRALLAHIVGWSRVFAGAASGAAYDGDPAAYEVGDDVAADFRTSATAIVDGWREHGVERSVPLTGGEMPGAMVLNMTFMEYLTHGWDLARATGKPVPFTDAEAEQTLRRAQATLRPEYRGQAIGPEVDVAADASAVDRLVAFMGRRP